VILEGSFYEQELQKSKQEIYRESTEKEEN
jgi:hypothetical protein